MLAKIWKKLGIFILIIACLFNIMWKLMGRVSFNTEVLEYAKYMYEQYQNQEKNKK